MPVYVIAIDKPNEYAWKAIRNKWPDRHYFANQRLAIIAPTGITLTVDIDRSVGMSDEHEVLGLEFEMSSYSGYSSRDVWEWLAKVQSCATKRATFPPLLRLRQPPSVEAEAETAGTSHIDCPFWRRTSNTWQPRKIYSELRS